DEATVLKGSKQIQGVDSSVMEDDFNFQETVLRSLDDLDAAHSTEVWQTIFTVAGSGVAVGFSYGRFAKIYAIFTSDPEIASQLRGSEAAEAALKITKMKNRLKKVARFLSRMSLPMGTAAAAGDQYSH